MCICLCVCVFVRVFIYVRDNLLMPMSHFIRCISQPASQPTSRQASQSDIRLANTKGVAALTFASLNFLFNFFLYGMVLLIDICLV